MERMSCFMDYTSVNFFSSFSINYIYTAYHARFNRDFRFSGETHSFWELDCVTDGKLGFTSGEHIYECSPYELVIHEPDIFHTSWAADNKNASLLFISFDGKYADRKIPCGKFTLNDEERFYVDMLSSLIPSIFDNTENFYAKQMTFRKDLSAGTMQKFKNLLELLILSLSGRNSNTSFEDSDPALKKQTELFSAIVRYMNDNICEPLDTQSICTEAGLSGSTLKKLFNKFTGGGVMEYYRSLRTNHAISLLSSGMSMAEISRTMNFSSQNYFSGFFKRETGMSPLEYSKKKL